MIWRKLTCDSSVRGPASRFNCFSSLDCFSAARRRLVGFVRSAVCNLTCSLIARTRVVASKWILHICPTVATPATFDPSSSNCWSLGAFLGCPQCESRVTEVFHSRCCQTCKSSSPLLSSLHFLAKAAVPSTMLMAIDAVQSFRGLDSRATNKKHTSLIRHLGHMYH